MIIEWENLNSFKRHMEDMEFFRRVHSRPAPREIPKQAHEIPAPPGSPLNYPVDFSNFFTGAAGKAIVIPMWKISMPESIQN